MVRTKSSPFYASALQVGALYGGASFDIAGKIKKLGAIYGEIVQIHDDLGDTMASPANPDWIQGRYPLPLLYAHVVDHPDRERIINLRKEIDNLEALEEAQAILIQCGAISYCLDQLMQRYLSAEKMLASMKLTNGTVLDKLLDEVVFPVREFAKTIGVDLPVEYQSELI